jgi:hypothetical protein
LLNGTTYPLTISYNPPPDTSFERREEFIKKADYVYVSFSSVSRLTEVWTDVKLALRLGKPVFIEGKVPEMFSGKVNIAPSHASRDRKYDCMKRDELLRREVYNKVYSVSTEASPQPNPIKTEYQEHRHNRTSSPAPPQGGGGISMEDLRRMFGMQGCGGGNPMDDFRRMSGIQGGGSRHPNMPESFGVPGLGHGGSHVHGHPWPGMAQYGGHGFPGGFSHGSTQGTFPGGFY